MTDQRPHETDAEEAHADKGSPTDAVTDEVREDATLAETSGDEDFPDKPALTHP